MSTYEEFMIILAACNLLVMILNYSHIISNPRSCKVKVLFSVHYFAGNG